MKLFLSSENLGRYPEEFVRLVGRRKLAYIGNAMDYSSALEKALKVQGHREQFESLGINFTELDLRDYFGRQDELEIEMNKYGAMWCSGGNTFLLRSAFQQSGLDTMLVDKIKNEGFVYGGSSAGAILPGPTLKGTENGDDPEQVRKTYKKDICWSGLELVDFVVVPHYDSDWFGTESREMVKYLIKYNYPYKILKDGQVFVIEDNKKELLL